MVFTEQQEVRNENPRNWMNDMMTFFSRNGYHQGLGRDKRREYRL